MDFKVQAGSLKNALSAAYEVATRGAVKDYIGENKVRLEAKEDEILVSAFNGRVAIHDKISNLNNDELNYKHVEDGEVLVNAKDLLNVLDSFMSKEEVSFSNTEDTAELVIKLDEDDEQYQTLPIYEHELSFPKQSKKFSEKIKVRRDLFVTGMDKIAFAVGFEEEREKYLYWMLRAKKNKIRFAAGTGALFGVADYEGKDIIEVIDGKEANILMPRNHSPVINKLLSKSDVEYVTIKVSDDAGNDDVPYQLVIELGDVVIQLVGMNSNISWVEEDKLLNKDYDCKLVTTVSDWEYASRGAMATFNDDMRRERKISVSTLNVDLDNSNITVETKDLMKAVRKVPIVDSQLDNNAQENISFSCSSPYLNNIATVCPYSKNVQIETSNNVDSKPIIVRYYAGDKVQDATEMKEINTASGITQRFVMFFVRFN